MTSYRFSQEHNLQTVLWSIGGAIAATARFTCTAARWAAVHTARLFADALIVSAALLAVLFAAVRLLAALCFFCAPIVCKWTLAALPWAVGAAGLCGVLFVIVAYPVILLGAGVIALFAVATYPRSKAVAK